MSLKIYDMIILHTLRQGCVLNHINTHTCIIKQRRCTCKVPFIKDQCTSLLSARRIRIHIWLVVSARQILEIINTVEARGDIYIYIYGECRGCPGLPRRSGCKCSPHVGERNAQARWYYLNVFLCPFDISDVFRRPAPRQGTSTIEDVGHSKLSSDRKCFERSEQGVHMREREQAWDWDQRWCCQRGFCLYVTVLLPNHA